MRITVVGLGKILPLAVQYGAWRHTVVAVMWRQLRRDGVSAGGRRTISR